MKKVIIIEFVLCLLLGAAITYGCAVVYADVPMAEQVSRGLIISGVLLFIFWACRGIGHVNMATTVRGSGISMENYHNMKYAKQWSEADLKASRNDEDVVGVDTKDGMKYKSSLWSIARKYMMIILGVAFIAAGAIARGM